MKILFVCMANMSRSPMAQVLMEKLCQEKKLNITCDSAGTHDYNVGGGPDPVMITLAQEMNITLNKIGRQLKDEDLAQFDHILVMDNQNLHDINALPSAYKYQRKIAKLSDFSEQWNEIADPYSENIDFYRQTVTQIQDCLVGLIKHILETP